MAGVAAYAKTGWILGDFHWVSIFQWIRWYKSWAASQKPLLWCLSLWGLAGLWIGRARRLSQVFLWGRCRVGCGGHLVGSWVDSFWSSSGEPRDSLRSSYDGDVVLSSCYIVTRISLVLFQSDSFRCWFSFYVVVVYFVVEFMVTWLWCCGRASRFSQLLLWLRISFRMWWSSC